MLLKHVALISSSEENSDKFYKNLLGLRKMRSKILPASLSKQIFNLDCEYKIIDYSNEDIHFEIFIGNQKSSDNKKVEHVCLEVNDMELFLNKCKDMAVKFLQIPKGEFFLIFISDYDGNLFEIKEKK